MSTEHLMDALAGIPLVDHHVHGALRHPAEGRDLEFMLSESNLPIPDWMTAMDSQIGFAIRRWCAPILGLPPRSPAADYHTRRVELGEQEVTRRFLTAGGVGRYLLDTGHGADQVLDVDEMATLSGVPVHEVVRIESTFEECVRSSGSAYELIRDFPERLAIRSRDAVGLKSIIAYRYGFDFEPERPSEQDVLRAASRWLTEVDTFGEIRVTDPVLLRFIVWTAVDTGLPLQFHSGYGDPDLDLHRCNPLLLTRFIKAVVPTGSRILLLHCYPYQREAGYLAQVFPNVFFDVGLAVNYTGARSISIVAESLELAPFAKILFSSDAWGPAELHYLGAHLWRRAMASVLSGWVEADEWSLEDAVRVADMTGRTNAERVYGLGTRL